MKRKGKGRVKTNSQTLGGGSNKAVTRFNNVVSTGSALTPATGPKKVTKK